MDWNLYENWVRSKYAKSYANTIMCYSRKYFSLLNDVKQIDLLKSSIRNNVIKTLIVLSKYLGQNKQFKAILKDYGIKLQRPDAIQAFLRIMKASDSDILDWYSKAMGVLRDNEKLCLKLAKITGLRKQEVIRAFNKIIKLSRDDKLQEYYDSELRVLMHFKYPELFLRRTKNC